jgi:hypothetical protein
MWSTDLKAPNAQITVGRRRASRVPKKSDDRSVHEIHQPIGNHCIAPSLLRVSGLRP